MQELFGGRESRYFQCGEWLLLEDPKIRQGLELPEDLRGVSALATPLDAPEPKLIGGVREGRRNAFLRLRGSLPQVRVSGAAHVEIRARDQSAPCELLDSAKGVWGLPEDFVCERVPERQECHVVARFEGELEGRAFVRHGRTRLEFFDEPQAGNFRGLGKGDFEIESSSREFEDVEGPVPEVPFPGLGDERGPALDVLPLEPTARRLGPGRGEMSLDRASPFPWLVVGPYNNPEFVVLTGGPDEAKSPSDCESPQAADRRHWNAAFKANEDRCPGKVWRLLDGDYQAFEFWGKPERELLKAYRKRARLQNRQFERTVEETNLPARFPERGLDMPREDPKVETLLRALVARFRAKSGLPLTRVHEFFGSVFGLSEGPDLVLREHLVRAYFEAGLIDVCRRAGGRGSVVAARLPRFAICRRGPQWSATAVGLMTREDQDGIRRTCEERQIEVQELRGPHPLIPSVVRVRATSLEAIEEVREARGFEPSRFVDWPTLEDVPKWLHVHGEYDRDVPEMYRTTAVWDWPEARFLRRAAAEGVRLERRERRDHSRLYAVMDGEQCLGWSYSRTWGLIFAYEINKEGFLDERDHGVLRVEGRSPVHLPLPFGRFCAIAGLALPGPVVDPQGKEVEGYSYPFGPKVWPLMRRAMPGNWLRGGNGAGSDR